MTPAAARQKYIFFEPRLAQKVSEGVKTQTRRLLKPQPKSPLGEITSFHELQDGWHGYVSGFRSAGPIKLPFRVGDLLYVRETWAYDLYDPDQPGKTQNILYRGAFTPGSAPDTATTWTPSIHMPKWAARTWLEVTSVRVERVQEITHEEAKAEETEWPGKMALREKPLSMAQLAFSYYWNSRYPGSWDRNDFVGVYGFRKVEAQKEISK